MKKYSIISVDSNSNYLFLTPIAAKCWRKIGYEPIIILVKENTTSEDISLLKNTSECRVIEIDGVANFRTCNVAQISRIFIPVCEFFNDDDYIIYGDADMLTLSERWFNQQDWSKNIHIFDAEELNYTRHKMCYIGAKVKKWREILNLKKEQSFNNYVQNHLKTFVGENADWDKGWNYDEKFLFDCLTRSPDYPLQCQMIERGANRFGGRNNRVDKVEVLWKMLMLEYISSFIIDVHVPKESYKDKIWEDLKIMLSTIFKKDEIDFFEEYKRKFVKILSQKENHEK